jgi:hypothetical protein
VSSERCSIVFSGVVHAHNATKHNTPIHNILSTAPQLTISTNLSETFLILRTERDMVIKVQRSSSRVPVILAIF